MDKADLRVAGFQAAALKAGIRGKDRLDLGLIHCTAPASAAGVFTTNVVKAAPVLLDMKRLAGGKIQAILVNSGVANACTGAEGMRLAEKTASLVASALNIPEDLVLVSSTGVIGEQLDLSCFENNMASLVAALSPDGFMDVARAIMTTDTVPKTATRRVMLNGCEVKLMGLAKGAGMIMPNMATMLSFVLTDAKAPSHVLQGMLKNSVEFSFNAITVDGDTSTNDSVIIMASGRANNSPLGQDKEDNLAFQKGLDDLLKELALMIVADGEGATKLITIRVEGARNHDDARRAAITVANSSLVKTAFFGEDANWGRIIAALGRSGAGFDPDRVDIAFDDVVMVRDGLGKGAEIEKSATEVLNKKQLTVTITLKAGSAAFEAYTCDLSLDYVKINADYRT